MKRIFFAVLLAMFVLSVPLSALAQSEEPVIYIIRKGDTLWGLSDRFLNDPYYWPDLWARNPRITNPHLIYPGQQVRIYPDRIEIGPAPETKTAPEEVAPAKTFLVTGGEGFLLEKEISPAGHIIATPNERNLLGEDDVAYTDIGKNGGAKPGDRYSIFKEMETIKHPVTNAVMGQRVASLGTLQLAEIEDRNSTAIITHSYQEIGADSYLMPYRERKREVALKAAGRDIQGYIVSARDGNISIGAGDVAYLDLGKNQGLEVGNLLYVVRDIKPDKIYTDRQVGNLPKDVIGALVVVEALENTSTGLIIKSVKDIQRGDRVELNKN